MEAQVTRRQQVSQLMIQGIVSPTQISKTIGTHISYVARLIKEIKEANATPVVETVVVKPKAKKVKEQVTARSMSPYARQQAAKQMAVQASVLKIKACTKIVAGVQD